MKWCLFFLEELVILEVGEVEENVEDGRWEI